MNAARLLQATLPADDDVPPLDDGGAEAVAPDEAAWALDQIGRLSDDPAPAEQRALAVFGGDRTALARHGRELVYRLVEEPAVRAELLPPAGEAEAVAPVTPFPALAAAASPSLRKAVVG